MTVGDGDAVAAARDEVVGRTITGVCFFGHFIEVHIDGVILTGLTKPFGLIGCRGVGPESIVSLIGSTVDGLAVEDGEYVAIDLGESRLAFPIGGPTATGPESVRLVRPRHHELGVDQAMWIW